MAVRASEAPNSTKLLITGGSHIFQFNETSSTAGHAAFQRLFNHICDRAFHNSDECDEVKCHPGTRTAILQVLFDFANDSEHPFITWLNGPAGAGKTAIARSLAERCEEAGILAASFFFWRSDLERSDEKRLIPTLVYQLCISIPLLRPFVEQSITNDPAIFSKTLTRQLSALILVPLQQIQASHSTFAPQSLPRLIIIDGLDECGGQNTDRAHRQGRALEILRQLASHQDIFPFRILVVSRTEAYIRRRFEEPSLQLLTRPLILNYSFVPKDDILVFVTHEFLWIVNHHPFGRFLPAGWPGNKVIQSIVDKSSGQFIYAATVMKFIRSELHRPDTRLALVQGAAEHKGGGPIMHFAPIDTLYKQIFCSAIDVPVALIVLTHHFTHRLAGFRPDLLDFPMVKKRRPPQISDTFGYPLSQVPVRHSGINPFVPIESIEKSLKLDPGVIPHTLSHFESLFTVSPSFTFAGRGYIKFHHASLTDFLFDQARSQEWFIDLSLNSTAFAMADLAEFEDMETEPAIRKGWFLMFCSAVRRSPRTPCLDSAISGKWLRPSQYLPATSFFESCGVEAFTMLDVLKRAAARYYRLQSTEMTKVAMHKSFLTDLLIVFEPKIQVYRSSPYLFAFLLCSSHLNHRPHRGRRPAMHPFPICSCPMFSSCWVWLADYIERRPSLMELDSQELQLIHIREPRHDHHDPHDEPNKNLDKPRWLHSCLDKLVESSIYVPPDDELLKESILIILKILLRIVHISFAFIDISQHMQGIISALLKPLSPSAEIAELLELIQTALVEYSPKFTPNEDIQQYLASCSQLPRSGLAPDFSFFDQEYICDTLSFTDSFIIQNK